MEGFVLWLIDVFGRFGLFLFPIGMVLYKALFLGRPEVYRLSVDVAFANLAIDVWALVTVARGGTIVAAFRPAQMHANQLLLLTIFTWLHLILAGACARLAFRQVPVADTVEQVGNTSRPALGLAIFFALAGLGLWLGVL